ncbi:hypothetical protein MLD52_22485 [Puniceicoccaceae bacterium K14]|nr:hypothetical protein [Puniceicoccaceae bacterium K14]
MAEGVEYETKLHAFEQLARGYKGATVDTFNGKDDLNVKLKIYERGANVLGARLSGLVFAHGGGNEVKISGDGKGTWILFSSADRIARSYGCRFQACQGTETVWGLETAKAYLDTYAEKR